MKVNDRTKAKQSKSVTSDKKMGHKLQELNALLRSLVESPPDIIILSVDTDFNYTFFNAAHVIEMKKVWGVDIEVGKNLLDYISSKEEREKVRKNFNRILTGKQFTKEEAYGEGENRFWYHITYNPIFDNNNNATGITVFIIDITARKKAEEKLKKSERRFLDISENTLEWIWEVDSKGKYIYSSPVVEKILGYKPEEMIGKHFYDIFHPEDLRDLKKAAFGFFTKKQPFWEFLNRNIHKNGKTVWLSTSGIPLLDEKGGLLGYRGSDIDITDRRIKEEELIMFKFLSDNSNDAHFLLGRDAKFLYVNETACKIMGHSEEELLTLVVPDIDAVYDMSKFHELFDLIQKEPVPPIESINKRKDGTTFPSEITVTGYQIGDRPLMFAALRDITERKHYEETVLSTAKGVSATIGKNFFYSLVEHLTAILQADYAYIAEILPDNIDLRARTLSLFADGKFIDNIEVDLSGTPCKNVLKKGTYFCPSGIQTKFPDAHIMAQLNVEGYFGNVLSSSSGKKLGLLSVLYKKPPKNITTIKSMLQIFAARASAELERRNTEKSLQNAHDELELRVKERTYELEATIKLLEKEINNHKVTEQCLRYNEKRFRAIADSTSDLLWDGNINDNTLEWFGDIDSMLGYDPGKFPRTIEGHLEHIHPDDRKSVIKSIEKAIETGKDFYAEYRIRCKDGTYRYWDENGKAIGFQKGKPVRWVGAVSDVTGRKKTEEELLSAEKELKSHANELIESNAALKVLLKQREQDKLDFENNIMSNIKHLIMPYIEKLKTNGLEKDGLAYLSIIESNMKEIVSPFATKLSFQFMDFTPREIMIADLIKDGKQDKDIMSILNISLDTVKTHRKNIRKKLDIYGKRINLRTKLLSFMK